MNANNLAPMAVEKVDNSKHPMMKMKNRKKKMMPKPMPKPMPPMNMPPGMPPRY